MTLRVSELAGEYAAVAAWTGQTEEQVRTGAGFHGGAHLIAWDGDRIVGLAHRWHDRHAWQRLMFRRCDAAAYEPLVRAVRGGCTASVVAGDDPAVAALAAAGFTESGRSREYEIPVPRNAPAAGPAVIPAPGAPPHAGPAGLPSAPPTGSRSACCPGTAAAGSAGRCSPRPWRRWRTAACRS